MTTAVLPFRQYLRIWTLRALFVALLPVLLLTEPAITSPGWADIMESLGVLLIVAGVLTRFWAILYIGGRKNRQVISDGPYSVCRHPLYLGSTLATFGFGMLTYTVTLTVLIGGVTFVVLMLTARREERFLRQEFGAAYAAYAARVPLIIPRPAGYQSPPEITFSTADLRTQLRDAFVFLSLFPLTEVFEWIRDLGILPTITLW
jgi:protein-S-isoprenylcysteine O-methyltransferase Ste14